MKTSFETPRMRTLLKDHRRVADIYRRALKFRSISNACNFASSALKPMRIVHGDDEMLWCVSPAEAEFLNKFGYELAEVI